VEPTEQNLGAWFNAGAMCVGLGSQLFSKDILQQRDWIKLRQNIENAISIVARVRK
jgi:2-dehydro-3-deoxyphosphogluconate aldolase / (4S)-4-hydroxy-2-oxoglutarate aldolase